MTTLDLAAEAMLSVQDGNRSFAAALARTLRTWFAGAGPSQFGGPSFAQQEPDLAKETHLPGTYGAMPFVG